MPHYRMTAEPSHTILPAGLPAVRLDAPQEAAQAPLVDERVVARAWDMPEAVAVALDEAQGLKAVTSAADYEYAVDVAKRLAAGRKAAEAFYKPVKQLFDRLKARVLGAEDDDLQTLEREGKRVLKLATAWQQAQAERERAEREAHERQERELAKRQRQEEVERLRRAAERVPDANVALAIETEAAQLAAAPIAEPKSTFQSAIPAVRGFTPARVTYSARCDDLMALARAVVAGTVPLDALQANQARLNKAAVDSKEALAWPGVTVLKSGSPVVRG